MTCTVPPDADWLTPATPWRPRLPKQISVCSIAARLLARLLDKAGNIKDSFWLHEYRARLLARQGNTAPDDDAFLLFHQTLTNHLGLI